MSSALSSNFTTGSPALATWEMLDKYQCLGDSMISAKTPGAQVLFSKHLDESLRLIKMAPSILGTYTELFCN